MPYYADDSGRLYVDEDLTRRAGMRLVLDGNGDPMRTSDGSYRIGPDFVDEPLTVGQYLRAQRVGVS